MPRSKKNDFVRENPDVGDRPKPKELVFDRDAIHREFNEVRKSHTKRVRSTLP